MTFLVRWSLQDRPVVRWPWTLIRAWANTKAIARSIARPMRLVPISFSF